MKFYDLDQYPRGDTETRAATLDDVLLGDAPVCPVCGAYVGMLAWLPPFRVVLELYGKQFGDFVFCVGDDFLVSERFRDIYHSHNLTGLTGFEPVEVTRIRTRRRNKPTPPPYFHVGVTYGPGAIDLTASGLEWIEAPTCTYCHTGNIMRWKGLILEAGTWTGEDIFRPRGLSGRFMVSQRFKNLCAEHCVTNGFFTPAEIAGHDFYPGLNDPSELDRFK